MRRSLSIQVALLLPDRVPLLIPYCQGIVKSVGSSIYLANITPTVAVVSTDVAKLVDAHAATKSRTKGAVEQRDACGTIVITHMKDWQQFVQKTCDATPAMAAVIIESAGMSQEKEPSPRATGFRLKHAKTPGDVHLFCKAAEKKAVYRWRSSGDLLTWVEAEQTFDARTTISGLTPGALTYFQHMVTTKAAAGSWSDAISAIIL